MMPLSAALERAARLAAPFKASIYVVECRSEAFVLPWPKAREPGRLFTACVQRLRGNAAPFTAMIEVYEDGSRHRVTATEAAAVGGDAKPDAEPAT